jgi:hypothetical protein
MSFQTARRRDRVRHAFDTHGKAALGFDVIEIHGSVVDPPVFGVPKFVADNTYLINFIHPFLLSSDMPIPWDKLLHLAAGGRRFLPPMREVEVRIPGLLPSRRIAFISLTRSYHIKGYKKVTSFHFFYQRAQFNLSPNRLRLDDCLHFFNLLLIVCNQTSN